MEHRVALAQQPIVDSAGWTVGFEILSRFFMGDSPDQFLIPDQISFEIPWHVIDSVVASHLPLIMRKLPGHEHLFVNISEQTWQDDALFDAWVEQIAFVNRMFPKRLVVEVSERIDLSLMHRRWPAIRSTGVMLALDDYDDSHATNSVLESLDWDFCKFNLHRLDSLEDVSAIDYCRRNGVFSIIERIETPIDSFMARTAGATLMQGFLYGRPVTAMRVPCHVSMPTSHTTEGALHAD